MRPLIKLLERFDVWRRAKLFVTSRELCAIKHEVHEQATAAAVDAALQEELGKMASTRLEFSEKAERATYALDSLLKKLVSIDEEALTDGGPMSRTRLMLEIADHVIEAAAKDGQVAQVLVGQVVNTVGQQVTLLIQKGGQKRIITPGAGLIVPR